MTTVSARAEPARRPVLRLNPGRWFEPWPSPGARPGYRSELQGLRGVAIGMVVAYHIFFSRVSGGVDVFLLISAFLMTGSFADRMERGRPLRIVRYWIKAFKRLLPPAVVTVVGVLVLMRLFYPAYRWREILAQALASVFYVENWHLAASSVDYYASDKSLASPLQHFWSLSVQGQVFLLWPLLFVLASLLARRFGWSVRRALTVVFGGVFVASLGWSVWATSHQQVHAYFDTYARLWEFALGSLLAIGLPVIERRWGFGPSSRGGLQPFRTLRVLAGWTGLVSMLAVGLVVDVEGAFPGWIALWPLLSACLVIAAGNTGTPWGVDHWLSSPPLRRLGDISYSLYLVHWPILITLLVIQDTARPGRLAGLVLVLVALRAGWVLTKHVDAPIRRSSTLATLQGRAVLVVLLSLVLGAGPALVMRQALDMQAARALAASAVDHPGAAVLTGGAAPTDPSVPPIPLPQDVPSDWVGTDRACSGRLAPDDPVLQAACGMTNGEEGKVIVVVGNSRAQQLNGALKPLAALGGYTIVAVLKGGCHYAFEGVDGACLDWNERVRDYLLHLRPRAVYTTTTFVPGGDQGEVAIPGMAASVTELTAAGIDVIGLRDQPRLPMNPIACASERSIEQCTIPTRGMLADEDLNAPLVLAAQRPGRFHPIDLTPWICPDGECPPVIGNVFVYLDAAHLSGVYAATLAPVLNEQLEASGWRW